MSSLTKSFSIDYMSDQDDRRYNGTFTIKKLTIGDLSKLGHRKAQLCGGLSFDPETGKGVDPGTAMLNEMIAHCEIAMLSKPDWFDSENMTDVTLLQHVYQEVASFEASFLRDKSQTEGQEATRSSEVSSSNESSGTRRTTSSLEEVVDLKIPKVSPLA